MTMDEMREGFSMGRELWQEEWADKVEIAADDIMSKLDELEEGHMNASSSPWLTHFDGAIYQSYSRGERDIFAPGSFGMKEDAVFICALRNAAPDLIAAVRERDDLRALLSQAEGALTGAKYEWDKLTRYGSPLAKNANENFQRVEIAIAAIRKSKAPTP